MDKKQCAVVRDLIPLVADEVASEESKAFVQEHIGDCENCRAYYEGMTAQLERSLSATPTQTAFESFCRKMKKQLRLRKLLKALIALILTVALLLGGAIVYRDRTQVWYQEMPEEWADAQLWRYSDGEIGIRITPREGKRWFSSYSCEYADGIFYIDPTMPEWPLWYLGTDAVRDVSLSELRWEDGTLYYVTRQWSFEDGDTREEKTIKKPIHQLCWGGRDKYTTLYVRGETISLYAQLP